MICIHTDISNKPDLIFNDLSTSISHASEFELDSIDIKPVIEDTACLDISCLNNCFSLAPRIQEHKVSLFLFVIIAGRSVTDECQILCIWTP
jgi:hypothetical protein